MSDRRQSCTDDSRRHAVAAYKTLLMEVIVRRPSGTRHRLAQALGSARSFVTQITNPSYTIAIPAKHLPVIFEICHLAPNERERFLSLYAQAHPRRSVPTDVRARVRSLHLMVPDLGSAEANADLDRLIRDYISSLGRVAAAAQPQKPELGRTP